MNRRWVGAIICLVGILILAGTIFPGRMEERNMEITLARAIQIDSAEETALLPEEMLSTCSVELQTRWRGLTLASKTEAITQRILLICARPPAGETFAIRARVDEPARLIFPDNDNSKPLTPSSPLLMSWALHPGDARKWEGTLWTYLSIPGDSGDSVEVVLSSTRLGGKTMRLIGLNFPQSLAAGICMVMGGLLIFLGTWPFLRKKN